MTPEKDRRGDAAAEAAALVSGLDTLVVVALNQSIDPGPSPKRTGPISNPDPAEVRSGARDCGRLQWGLIR